MVNIDAILPPLYALRKNMGDLEELKTSIKNIGLIEPIVVTPRDNKKYLLIAGHRRWVACKELGLSEIRVEIRETKDDKEVLEIAIAENITRRDLDLFERANIFLDYLQKYKFGTILDLGRISGYTPSYIYQTLDILKLPQKILTMIEKGELPSNKALVLSRVKDDIKATMELAENADLMSSKQLGDAISLTKKGYAPRQAITEVLRPSFDWMETRKPPPHKYNPQEVAREHIIKWLQAALKGIDMELKELSEDEVHKWVEKIRYPLHQLVDEALKIESATTVEEEK